MYADRTYYRDTFIGLDASDDAIDAALTRASMDVNSATGFTIGDTLDDLEDWQTTPVKNATCIQAEHYVLSGYDETYDSLKIGQTSISGMDDGLKKGALRHAAMAMLEQTGLMYNGVRTI